MSAPDQPPPPDIADLRGLARGLRQLFELGARMLAEDAGPSELAVRVTGHLGCELTAAGPSVAHPLPPLHQVRDPPGHPGKRGQ